ncbi:MAG: hypothetical protein AAB217_16575, partial [Chloroflexota bacterium]
HLPEMLYQKLAQRAQQMQRSVEDELVEVVEAGLPVVGDLPAEVADEIAQLAFLTDNELWQAAESTLPETDSERMQALILKRQRERLTEAEQEEAERLRQRHDRNMLIRAKAAALLKERGHDVSRLGPASVAE